ncbi:hypothetical protein G9A89_023746 [Geosiphon pyriformis]|nr:hypothetical protein G9A89_023746 [Geosiphon pyriformis]
MFIKKSARGITTSSVSRSLRQKSKVLLGKVKHSGDEADLSFKLPSSDSDQYENMDISSNEKLGYKMSKNLGYGAGSESDELLDSCTNTPKAKHFNSSIVKVLSLGFCDFGSVIDNVNMGLPLLVSLESPFCLVASIKKKLCFELTKSFALNIGLLAIPRSTLHDKLKDVRKLFYKIDGFGGVSTLSKFLGIVKVSFISDSSLILAKQLVMFENLVVNTNLKKIEILVNLPKLAIELALVKYGKIFSIKMQLIGLWQKALMEFKSSQIADLVVSKWSILLGKNLIHVAKANANKQIWDLRDSYYTFLYILLIGTTAYDLLDLV